MGEVDGKPSGRRSSEESRRKFDRALLKRGTEN